MRNSELRSTISPAWRPVALFIAFATCCSVARAQAAPPPLKAFFSKPALSSVALLSSGDTLAITVPGSRGRMELAIADLKQKPLPFNTFARLRHRCQ